MPRSAIFSQVPHTPVARCFDLPRAAQKRPRGGAGVIYIHNRKHVAYKHMESNSLRYSLFRVQSQARLRRCRRNQKHVHTPPYPPPPSAPTGVCHTQTLLRPRTAPRAQGLWGCRRGGIDTNAMRASAGRVGPTLAGGPRPLTRHRLRRRLKCWAGGKPNAM